MSIYPNDSLRPVAGNQFVPDSMEARGKIVPKPPIQDKRRNGAGLLVAAGPWSYEWHFKYLNRTDFQWWVDLIGNATGVASPVFSKAFFNTGIAGSLPAARLWDMATRPTNFKSAVIDVPTWQDYKNGLYLDVVVSFSYLRPEGA